MGECLIVRRGGEAYTLPTLNGSYPANVTVMESAGASASFSVQIATPGKPAEYTYQWYVNSAKVTGATGSSYTKAGLTAAATYSVYCVVTNKAGTVTSRMATLTVESSQPAFTYSGTYQLMNDGGYNWRLKLLTSGTLVFSRVCPNVNVFMVGGGGGGVAGGGGGGYTATISSLLQRNTPYVITIGGGGSSTGGTTSAFGSSAAGGGVGGGGTPGGTGGPGGSGGGASYKGNGGSDGGNGGSGYTGAAGGAGQGRTTREFGEASGTLYAGGGGGSGGGAASEGAGGAGGGGAGGYGFNGPGQGINGTVNTGGGGGSAGGVGGSGIVVIRNAR